MAVEEAELHALARRVKALEGGGAASIPTSSTEGAVDLPTREEVRDAILDFSAAAVAEMNTARERALEEIEAAKKAALEEILAAAVALEKKPEEPKAEEPSENQQG